ncbi:iron-sulfur cluster assembly scaffold protein [Candidatus Pacearchaeota archaeon]|nr:iron-sulfur cluster assembly scaffold protein [Candidatus Pacearchaeota archaeon]
MANLEYSKELMKHFKNPKYVKTLKNPSGIGEVGNIRCGDIMHLEIKVDEKGKGQSKKIKDIGFKTFGCPSAIAASDVVCDIAKGKTLKQAKKITKDQVLKKLKGLPTAKIHCSVLGIDALKKAIKDYEEKNG